MGVDWVAVELAGRRHDDRRFRAEVEAVLDDRPVFFAWQELTRSLLSGDATEVTAAQAVDGLFRAAADAPAPLADARRALVAVYLYFAILALWELSDDHNALLEITAALRGATSPLASSDPDDVGCDYDAITLAVGRVARALEPAFAWEQALFCSCPVGLADAARSVRVVLEPEVAIRGEAPSRLVELRDRFAMESGGWHLVELLSREASAMLDYAGLLAVAADAGGRFIDGLEDRLGAEEAARDAFPGCASLREYLEWAAIEAEGFAEPLKDTVYASGVRTFVRVIERMAVRLHFPSLTVENGEIVLLYPFGLPRVAEGSDALVRRLVQSEELRDRTGKRFELLGLPVDVREVAMTNTFASLGSRDGHSATFAAQLTFDAQRLMLVTTAHTRVEGIDIDVRLGSLGNHCVRVAVTTEHRTYASDDTHPLPGEIEFLTGPWTAHDIDQWVRRIGYEVGTEHLWFEGADGKRTREFTRVVEIADAIVTELEDLLQDPPRAQEPAHVNDLHANAQVVVVVQRASARAPDGSGDRTLQSHDELVPLLGAEALLTPQRGLPTALEDWVLYEPTVHENLLDGFGRPGDLLAVAGDVSLVCSLATPSWATVELRHLVEFAISAIGPLAAWSVWLRHTIEQAHEVVEEAKGKDHDERVIDESIEVARNVSRAQALTDRLTAAHLMRSHRDRALLDRFMSAAGMDALKHSLNESIEATISRRQYVSALADKVQQDRRRRSDRVVSFLLGLIALGGLFAFFDWYGSSFRSRPVSHRWWAILILSLAIGVFLLAFFGKFHDFGVKVGEWKRARAKRHGTARRGPS